MPAVKRSPASWLPLMALLAACGAIMPQAGEIPIGGVRPLQTRDNLHAARERLVGGLLEASWLPPGFELTVVEYQEDGGRIRSADLNYAAGAQYTAGAQYMHIWQSDLTPAELGDKDPLPAGEPLPDTGWYTKSLLPFAGRGAVMEYSTRLADGRTVIVDSNLDEPAMRRMLGALVLRSTADG